MLDRLQNLPTSQPLGSLCDMIAGGTPSRGTREFFGGDVLKGTGAVVVGTEKRPFDVNGKREKTDK